MKYNKHLAGALLGIAVMAVTAFGAAPLIRNFGSATGDVTIDNEWDSQTAGWDVVDSLIVVASDSARTIMTISGFAVVGASQRLYLGIGNDSANRVDSATSATTGSTNSNLDTALVQTTFGIGTGQFRVPFSFTYISETDGANTDTFYFNAAVGSASRGALALEDVVVTASVADQ